MRKVARLGVGAALALLPASAIQAEGVSSSTFNLRYNVPVLCKLAHTPKLAASGSGYGLGELLEYCNAATGYSLMVNYTPGTMRGASIAVGNDHVTLSGSGREVISRVGGPRIREREIYAQPGPAGFDTDRLDFDIKAS